MLHRHTTDHPLPPLFPNKATGKGTDTCRRVIVINGGRCGLQIVDVGAGTGGSLFRFEGRVGEMQ
jgi:hypothetical protein